MFSDFWLKVTAIAGIALAVVGGIFKAGKNHAEVAAIRKRERVNADETKVRNDVGALSGSAARDKLRDKWSAN